MRPKVPNNTYPHNIGKFLSDFIKTVPGLFCGEQKTGTHGPGLTTFKLFSTIIRSNYGLGRATSQRLSLPSGNIHDQPLKHGEYCPYGFPSVI